MKRRARGTGTIEKRLAADGSIKYFARCPNAARTPLGFFGSWKSASDALDVYLQENAAGLLVDTKRLGDYGLAIIDRRELEGYRSTADERRLWRRSVLPWGCSSWPLAHVQRRHVKEWLRELRGKDGQRLGEQTQRNALNLLRLVFAAAVDDDLLEHNPARDVRVKGHGRTDDTSTELTLDELAALFWSADDEGKHLVAFAAGTGMRSGELRSATVECFELECERPAVWVRYGSPGLPCKAGRVRRLPLFGFALEAARSWARSYQPKESSRHEPRPWKYFFGTKTGAARQRGKIVEREKWKAWLAAAGIKRRVRWHDLRHTCATLLLHGELGDAWSKEAVQDLLRHASITTTERYAKNRGELAEKAARGPSPSSVAAVFVEPISSQPPTPHAVSVRNLSRLGELDPGPTVYEPHAIQSEDAMLGAIVGLCVALLQRADRHGDVARQVVDAAEGLLDAIEASEASAVPRKAHTGRP